MATKTKVPLKAKNMMYTQQLTHLPSGDFDTLVDQIKEKLNPKKFAAIVHGNDFDEKGTAEAPHVHAMLSFENARSVNSIAKELGDKPQYVESWKGDAGNGYAYLIHATDNAKTKYQYKPTEVRANFNYLEELQKIKRDINRAQGNSQTKSFLDALYDGLMTKEELEEKLSGSEYAKIHRQIEDVWIKSLEKKAKLWKADMLANNKSITVIWVYGQAGTGKTSWAKEYSKKLNRDYFISGSTRDIFQGYAGQHTMIMDEFRPLMIKYPDLLRITDPFGADAQVKAPSRYFDKALACDLIIITSPYSPLAYYMEEFGGEYRRFLYSHIDSFEQLLRRINLTVEMTDDNIHFAKFDNTLIKYIPITSTAKQNPYSKKARQIPPTGIVTGTMIDALDMYDSIFK